MRSDESHAAPATRIFPSGWNAMSSVGSQSWEFGNVRFGIRIMFLPCIPNEKSRSPGAATPSVDEKSTEITATRTTMYVSKKDLPALVFMSLLLCHPETFRRINLYF